MSDRGSLRLTSSQGNLKWLPAEALGRVTGSVGGVGPQGRWAVPPDTAEDQKPLCYAQEGGYADNQRILIHFKVCFSLPSGQGGWWL